MKVVYTFAEYQAMIDCNNAVLPQVIEGFPTISMEEILGAKSADKRISIDHEKREISFEVPERFVLNISAVVVKHSSAIAAAAKAIKAVAEAMRSLFRGMKDEVEDLIIAEIAEVEKEQKQAA